MIRNIEQYFIYIMQIKRVMTKPDSWDGGGGGGGGGRQHPGLYNRTCVLYQ